MEQRHALRAAGTCHLPQSAFKETPDVKGFLFNPVVADQRKRELLSSLANDAGLSKHTLNFLNLLLDQVCYATNQYGMVLPPSMHFVEPLGML